MTSARLLAATQAASKRKLHGGSLTALLLVIDGPQTLGHLASRIGVSSPAMTGCADHLEKRGYAIRTAVSGDRRKLLLKITPKGIATIESILEAL